MKIFKYFLALQLIGCGATFAATPVVKDATEDILGSKSASRLAVQSNKPFVAGCAPKALLSDVQRPGSPSSYARIDTQVSKSGRVASASVASPSRKAKAALPEDPMGVRERRSDSKTRFTMPSVNGYLDGEPVSPDEFTKAFGKAKETAQSKLDGYRKELKDQTGHRELLDVNQNDEFGPVFAHNRQMLEGKIARAERLLADKSTYSDRLLTESKKKLPGDSRLTQLNETRAKVLSDLKGLAFDEDTLNKVLAAIIPLY